MKKNSKSPESSGSGKPINTAAAESSSSTPEYNETPPAPPPNSTQPLNDSEIEEHLIGLGRAVQATRQQLVKAAAHVVAVVDGCPNGYERIRARYPELTTRSLRSLYDVGRGRLLAEIALDPSIGASFIRKTPIELQRKLADGGSVPVLYIDGDTERVVNKQIGELTIQDCTQAITKEGLVPIDKQRASALRRQEVEVRPRYTILDDGRVRFNDSPIFSPSQLLVISAKGSEKERESLESEMRKQQLASAKVKNA